MCDTIYIGNTQKISKKTLRHLSDILRLLIIRQKHDSFAAHFEQNYKYTMSHTELHKCMLFKLVNQLGQIGAMKYFTKPNYNLCIQGL